MVKMLIGLPACGKSTYAKNLEGFKVLSSDSIREELYGDESIQKNPSEVFTILYKRMETLLADNQDVVFDATNIKQRDRKEAIVLAHKYHQCIEAIIFDVPLEVCLERNANRERQVPLYAYERMMKNFEMPTITEGFHKLTFVRQD